MIPIYTHGEGLWEAFLQPSIPQWLLDLPPPPPEKKPKTLSYFFCILILAIISVFSLTQPRSELA